jgi:dolichyl-phosphate beta-glucosyltransferase
MPIRLSVIVPALNEAANLENNLGPYLVYLESLEFGTELILVNDGSTDDTMKVARSIQKNHKNLKIINFKDNRGKGAAVRAGFKKAQGKYLAFLDADGATPIDHLNQVWPYFEQGYSAVIGSRSVRDVPNTRILVPQAGWKQALGKTGNQLIKLITGLNISDTQCGFKVFTREIIQKIIPLARINRWAFDVELLILVKKRGEDIAIIPVEWQAKPGSRVGYHGYSITKNLDQSF